MQQLTDFVPQAQNRFGTASLVDYLKNSREELYVAENHADEIITCS